MSLTKITYNGAVPAARSMHSAVNYKDKLIIFGGEDKDLLWRNDFYSFDINTKQMKQIDNSQPFFPPKRDGHTAIIMNDKMYIVGGSTSSNQKFIEISCYDFGMNYDFFFVYKKR